MATIAALAAAGGAVAGILTVGPRLHPATAAHRPQPTASTPPTPTAADPTDATTLPPTAAPIAAATASPTAPAGTRPPGPRLTPRPTPTSVPWSPPPQTVNEPQLFYVQGAPYQASDGTYRNRWDEIDWTGTVVRRLDLAQSVGGPTPSPDGSRVFVNASDILAPDGSTIGSLPSGWRTLLWDGDNLHLCRLDPAGKVSWVSPGTARPVATLPALPAGDSWDLIGCSSARNRILAVRYHQSSSGHLDVALIRSMELSSGRVIHDLSHTFPDYDTPRTSGNAAVVAVTGGGPTLFIDPDTGVTLHSASYAVNALSWNGNRAATTGSLCCSSAHSLVDWRHGDTTLWSTSNNSWGFFQHELSDDMAFLYATYPSSGVQDDWVDVVMANGSATTHSAPS